MSRRGFHLTELLFAAAILGVVLLAAYGLMQQGFANSVRVLRREHADTDSRNVLDRYARMPRSELAELFTAEHDVDIDDLEDVTLEVVAPPGRRTPGAFDRRLLLDELPGPARALLLRSEVTWTARDGREHRVGHRRYLFPSDGAPARARDAAGFALAAEVEGWGSAESWEAPVDPAPGSPPGGSDPGRTVAVDAGPPPLPLPPAGASSTRREGEGPVAGGPGGPGGGTSPGGAGEVGLAGSALPHAGGSPGGAGAGSGRAPRGVRARPGSRVGRRAVDAIRRAATAARFRPTPPPLGAAEAPGATGNRLLDRRWGWERVGPTIETQAVLDAFASPAAVEPRAVARARRAREEREFLARTGLPALDDLGMDKVPPGRYRYALEAIDLREDGKGRVFAVFLVRAGKARRPLVAVAEHRETVVRRLEGDPVLERAAARLPGVADAVFSRTEERLYLVLPGADPRLGELVVAELPGLDGSREGTAATRREVERFLAGASAARLGSDPPDLLVRGLPRRRAMSGVTVSGGVATARAPMVRALAVRNPVEVEEDLLAPLGPEPAREVRRRTTRFGQLTDLALRDPGAALGELSRFLAAHPRSLGARALRGRLHAAAGRPGEALDDLYMTGSYRRAPPGALVDLAGLLLRTARRDEASLVVERLRIEAPRHPLLPALEGALGGDPGPFAPGAPLRLVRGDRSEGAILAWGPAGS